MRRNTRWVLIATLGVLAIVAGLGLKRTLSGDPTVTPTAVFTPLPHNELLFRRSDPLTELLFGSSDPRAHSLFFDAERKRSPRS